MKSVTAFLLAAALPFAAFADRGNERRPPPRKPPPEAFAACVKAKQGDACSVKLPDRTVEGTCELLPEQTDLACRPNHPPPPPPPDDKS